ncbi:EutN/CcmL family microcompartment protein, partial [Weissella confusa]|uniref:EutN/CcmL family microcompartment protein n=1 Tax=Weissella confusa TaxID=1583 RepID=UPI001BCEF06F
MIIGKVVGSVISTRKCDKLVGSKFMVVEPLDKMKSDTSQFVAIDNIGAGVGETVLISLGTAARIGCG